jgi:hypothetical protein
VIRQGERPREGYGNGDPHRPHEQTREGTPSVEIRPAAECDRPLVDGQPETAGNGHIPEGNPLAHPLDAAEMPWTTETARNTPPTDLGPRGTKPRSEARASEGGDERHEGSRPQ